MSNMWQHRSGRQVTYPKDQPTECETESAEICSTTESIIVTTTTSQKPITTTSTISSCGTIYNCNVQDEAGTTIKSCTGGSTITLGRRAAVATAVPTRTAPPRPELNNHLEARADNCPNVYVDDYIVYPRDPDNVASFVDYLKDTRSQLNDSVTLWSKTKQVQGGAFTAFFYIKRLTNSEADRLRMSREYLGIAHHYGIVDNNEANNYSGTGSGDDEFLPDRDPWELSQISVPPGGDRTEYWDEETNPRQFDYDADDALGSGQTIFLVEDNLNKNLPVSARKQTLGCKLLANKIDQRNSRVPM